MLNHVHNLLKHYIIAIEYIILSKVFKLQAFQSAASFLYELNVTDISVFKRNKNGDQTNGKKSTGRKSANILSSDGFTDSPQSSLTLDASASPSLPQELSDS